MHDALAYAISYAEGMDIPGKARSSRTPYLVSSGIP